MMTLIGGGGLLPQTGKGSSATGAVLALAFIVIIIGLPYHQLLFTPPLFMEEASLSSVGSMRPATLLPSLTQQAGPAAKASFIIEKMAFGSLSSSFKFVNLLIWAVSIVTLFVMIRRTTQRPIFSLVCGIFVAVHTLNIPAVAMVSGRGLLVGMLFTVAAAVFAPTEPPQDMYQDIPMPRPIVPLHLIFLGIAVLASPVWALAPLWYAAFEKSFLHGTTVVTRKQLTGAAIVSVLLLAVYGILAPASHMWVGADFSLAERILAGFGALAESLWCVVYPRYIIWPRYATTFDASALLILGGVLVFAVILGGWLYTETRRKVSAEVTLGTRLLALGAFAAILEPVLTGKMPSMATPVILLPGVAILFAAVLSVIWRRVRRFTLLKLGFVAIILLLLVTASSRNEAVAWRWKNWPNLGSFYTQYSEKDAMYHLAWAEYFIRTGDPSKVESALKRLDKTASLSGLYPQLLKARAHAKLGNANIAAETYKRYLDALKTTDIKATMDYAGVLIDMEQFDEAEAMLQPHAASGGEAAYLSGIINERKGKYTKARDCLLNAANTQRGNPDTLVALGRVLLELNEIEKAKAYLELAMTKRNDHEVIALLTQCYIKLDKCVRAENLVRKALMTPSLKKKTEKELETLLASVKAQCFNDKDDGSEMFMPGRETDNEDEPAARDEAAPPDDTTTGEDATEKE